MSDYSVTVGLGGIGATATSGIFNVLDYGAVGDGTTDDYQAIADCLSAAKAASGRAHFPAGLSFAFEITIDLNGHIIDGNGATLIKNFDGIGLDITGGITYTEINDLTVEAGTGYKASDYVAGDTSHGIRITGTRHRLRRVNSYYHEGAGFYFDNTSGNMNKSVQEDIYGVGCSLAGIYMTGNYDASAGTGTNDMSIWNTWARSYGNYGYGIYVSDTCPIRQSTMVLYCESNGLGASFSSASYAAHFGLSRYNTIWIYAEQGGGSPSSKEVYFGTNAIYNVITSSRVNDDLDDSTDGSNKWIYGSIHYAPTPSVDRANTPIQCYNALARVGTAGEYTQQKFFGNGGTFGYLRGEGYPGGLQKLVLLSEDESNYVGIDDEKVILKSLRGIYVGSGSPETAVSAFPGSLYLNTSGGAGTTLYVKESGSGTNTGWVGK